MWDVLKDAVFYCIQFFYNICLDWGLAIIVITILFRVIITPLMFKQSESSYQMQKIQPLIKQVQTKYADDPTRQQSEMQRLYAEAKFNPLASCIPMLLQMPIFILLFQVLRDDGHVYLNSVDNCSFYNILPSLTISPSDAFAQGIGAAIPYLILLIMFAALTFIPSLLQLKNSSDPSQRNQTLTITVIMSVMMLFIGWGSPGGVLLFWATSSLLAIAQQQGSLAIVKSRDKKIEAELPAKPVKIEVERKEVKKRQRKKR